MQLIVVEYFKIYRCEYLFLRERKAKDFEKVCYLPTHFLYLCIFFIIYKENHLEKDGVEICLLKYLFY